jgi:hypothetical protein
MLGQLPYMRIASLEQCLCRRSSELGARHHQAMGGDDRHIVVGIIGGDSRKQSLALRMPQISQARHGAAASNSPNLFDESVKRPFVAQPGQRPRRLQITGIRTVGEDCTSRGRPQLFESE